MIVRSKRTSHFTMIDNALIEDSRISLKAKALLIYLLSKPDDWKVQRAQLANIGPDGMTVIRNALKELRECGYIVAMATRDETTGKITEWNHVVFDVPQGAETTRRETNPVDNHKLTSTVVKQVLKKQARTARGRVEDELPQQTGDVQDKSTVTSKEVYTAWEQNMPGTLTPYTLELIGELQDEVGGQAILEGIKVAIGKGKLFPNYVAGCARRWASGDGSTYKAPADTQIDWDNFIN